MKGGNMKNKELELIYKKYYQGLLLYALSFTHNKEDAEDLVSSAFVKAMLSFNKGNIKAWLYMVLKNEYYNLYKYKKRFVEEEKYSMDLIEDHNDILEDFVKNERKLWLYKQIYKLSNIELQVMLLSLQSDLNDLEISKIIDMSIENVRVIRFRVKKKLIKLSEEDDI
jgi:RNA polymerase sigma-70 factor (ECF subfamily)